MRRENYVGTWLPEPLLTDLPTPSTAIGDGPAHAELGESLSMAFLVVLEALTPVERAVFVLHDVFDFGYDEISGIVGKSEVNCRQIATRARRAVSARRPRFEPSPERREELSDRFFAAVAEGDVDVLVDLLAEDAVAYGDGGGRGPSLPRPVCGRERVIRLLLALRHALAAQNLHIEHDEVNGQPGALVRNQHAELLNVLALDIADGRVYAVRSVINPDKLRHLGPLIDR